MSVLDYSYMGEEDWDKAEPDQERTFQCVLTVADLLDDIFKDPPDNMRGRYLEEQTQAWNSYKKDWVADINATLRAPDPPSEPGKLRLMLARAGLIGDAARAKFRLLKDAVLDFRKIRNSFSAEKALRLSVYIMSSIANEIPGGKSIQEVCEAAKYIADRAVEKSSS